MKNVFLMLAVIFSTIAADAKAAVFVGVSPGNVAVGVGGIGVNVARPVCGIGRCGGGYGYGFGGGSHGYVPNYGYGFGGYPGYGYGYGIYRPRYRACGRCRRSCHGRCWRRGRRGFALGIRVGGFALGLRIF